MFAGCGAVQRFISKRKINKHPEYERGLPALDALFGLQAYIHGYLLAKDSGFLSQEDKKRIENTIKLCIYAKLHFPEWGAHNRSMLAVCSLLLAAQAVGANKEAEEWMKLAEWLAEET